MFCGNTSRCPRKPREARNPACYTSSSSKIGDNWFWRCKSHVISDKTRIRRAWCFPFRTQDEEPLNQVLSGNYGRSASVEAAPILQLNLSSEHGIMRLLCGSLVRERDMHDYPGTGDLSISWDCHRTAICRQISRHILNLSQLLTLRISGSIPCTTKEWTEIFLQMPVMQTFESSTRLLRGTFLKQPIQLRFPPQPENAEALGHQISRVP